MAKLLLYAAGITATFMILPMAAAAEDAALLKQAQGIFQPLPKDMATAEFPITRERVELGRLLFFDPRLTVDANMSCSSCHQPVFYGTDALPKPMGVKQRPHPRHVPTNLNAGTSFVSGDHEQEYFVAGITEDIITALSKWRWFLVIARNSTFAYKGKSVELKEVGRDLGARYILEGSMRRAGQRVRISGQLIDIATGTHLWAERYDRDLTDIFAVQDDITSRVAAAIEPALSRAESQRVIAKRPEHMGAWIIASAASGICTRAPALMARQPTTCSKRRLRSTPTSRRLTLGSPAR